MKLSLSSLSLVLSLCSVVRAGDVIEKHGYQVDSWGNGFIVSSPRYVEGCEFLNVMAFYPKWKVATIHIAKNDDEPDHKNKLGLTEVYNSLADREKVNLDEMRWVIFDVESEDTTTDAILSAMRRSRNLDPWQEVRILPGDKEWDVITSTQYYMKLLQVAKRPVQKVLVRNENLIRWWGKVTNRILFSFGPLKNKTPVPGTSAAEAPEGFDDEEQEAALKALFAEEEESGDEFQAEVPYECAYRILDAEDDDA